MSIERIFEYKYDERVMKLKRDRTFLYVALFIWVGLALLLLWFTIKPSYYLNTNVDYSELNQSERAYAYSIISDLKTDYLHLAKNIKFVKNESEICEDCAGENFMNNIKVLYNDMTEEHLKIIVCHELIHGAVSLNYDLEEEIVWDFGKTNVCYREKSWGLEYEE